MSQLEPVDAQDPKINSRLDRRLLGVQNEKARQWYMNEAATQNWSSRALDRQILTLHYERLLQSRDKTPATEEATTNTQSMKNSPRKSCAQNPIGNRH